MGFFVPDNVGHDRLYNYRLSPTLNPGQKYLETRRIEFKLLFEVVA